MPSREFRRSTEGPSIRASPSSSMPSSTKNATAATRSPTTNIAWCMPCTALGLPDPCAAALCRRGLCRWADAEDDAKEVDVDHPADDVDRSVGEVADVPRESGVGDQPGHRAEQVLRGQEQRVDLLLDGDVRRDCDS